MDMNSWQGRAWPVAIGSLVGLVTLLSPSPAGADNPIIQTKFTADPAPMVYGDTVYLYTSHDEDNATGFTMYNWLLYTSTDMVNWTDRGIIGGVKDPNKTFKWSDGVNAWAPQVIPRNGKFYLYAPFPKGGHMVIGVAVADQPTGPFVDALNGPLINNPSSSTDIDPTVFIDSDGQGYLYWGHQPSVSYVKLNQDMISYSGGIMPVTRPQTFEEGPWFYRRNDSYYLAFASTCCPEGIGYAMSSSPTGPWTYKGSVMDPTSASSGNHPGIIDYKGNSYVFGFDYFLNNNLTNGAHQERRSINVAQFTYNPDGSIPKVPWWTLAGVSQLGRLNPYVRTEAETIAFESGPGTVSCTSSADYDNCWKTGVKTEVCGDAGGGMDVTSIQNGSYIKVQGVDFGAGASSLDVRIAGAGSGGTIDVRLSSPTGKVVGTCMAAGTGGDQMWTTSTCAIDGATGVQDLFFVFRGGAGNLFNFNWWQFHGPGADAGMTGDDGGSSSTGGAGGRGGAGGLAGASGGSVGHGGGTAGARGGGAAGGESPGTGSGGSRPAGTGGAGLSGSGGSPSSTGGSGSSSTGGPANGGPGTGGAASGGVTGTGGASPSTHSGGTIGATGGASGSSGCACALGRSTAGGDGLFGFLLFLGVGAGLRRRRPTTRSRPCTWRTLDPGTTGPRQPASAPVSASKA